MGPATISAIVSGIISLAGAGAKAVVGGAAQRRAAAQQGKIDARKRRLEERQLSAQEQQAERQFNREQRQFARTQGMADIQNKMTQEDLEKQKQAARTSLVQGAVSSARAKPVERLGRTQRSLLRLGGGA